MYDIEANMIQMSMITAFISLLKPYIMNIFKFYATERVHNNEVRKSINHLAALTLGTIIAIVVNIMGEFGLSVFTAVLIGTGVSYPAGQLTNRGIKLYENIKNGKNGN